MHLPGPVQRAHLVTQQRLLEAEREGSARLLAAIAEATGGVYGRSPSALVRASQDVVTAVAEIVRALRVVGRAAGRSTLANEIRVAGEAAARPGLQRIAFPMPDEPTLADQIAADRAANDYAAAWLTKAGETGPAQATQATRYRASAVGGAEVGQAFGMEREAVMRRMARQPEFSGAGVILKIWDARLDACPKCRGLDGKIRPLGVSFPGGKVAGAVHLRCRCIAGIVILGGGTVSQAA